MNSNGRGAGGRLGVLRRDRQEMKREKKEEQGDGYRFIKKKYTLRLQKKIASDCSQKN